MLVHAAPCGRKLNLGNVHLVTGRDGNRLVFQLVHARAFSTL